MTDDKKERSKVMKPARSWAGSLARHAELQCVRNLGRALVAAAKEALAKEALKK